VHAKSMGDVLLKRGEAHKLELWSHPLHAGELPRRGPAVRPPRSNSAKRHGHAGPLVAMPIHADSTERIRSLEAAAASAAAAAARDWGALVSREASRGSAAGIIGRTRSGSGGSAGFHALGSRGFEGFGLPSELQDPAGAMGLHPSHPPDAVLTKSSSAPSASTTRHGKTKGRAREFLAICKVGAQGPGLPSPPPRGGDAGLPAAVSALPAGPATGSPPQGLVTAPPLASSSHGTCSIPADPARRRPAAGAGVWGGGGGACELQLDGGGALVVRAQAGVGAGRAGTTGWALGRGGAGGGGGGGAGDGSGEGEGQVLQGVQGSWAPQQQLVARFAKEKERERERQAAREAARRAAAQVILMLLLLLVLEMRSVLRHV